MILRQGLRWIEVFVFLRNPSMAQKSQSRLSFAWLMVVLFAVVSLYQGAFYFKELFKRETLETDLALKNVELQSARNLQEAQSIIHAREVQELVSFKDRLKVDLLVSKSKRVNTLSGAVVFDPISKQGDAFIYYGYPLKEGLNFELSYTGDDSKQQLLGVFSRDELKHEAKLHFPLSNYSNHGFYRVHLIGVKVPTQNLEGSVILQSP